jgi:hypothetical protein
LLKIHYLSIIMLDEKFIHQSYNKCQEAFQNRLLY